LSHKDAEHAIRKAARASRVSASPDTWRQCSRTTINERRKHRKSHSIDLLRAPRFVLAKTASPPHGHAMPLCHCTRISPKLSIGLEIA